MGNIQEELREKWKSGMKEALQQAVVKVLSEDGLQGLTMDRITQEAGIGKGTIYNYFHDKQDLLRHVVRSSMEPLEMENGRILSSDTPPPDKLRSFVSHTLSYFDEHRNFYRVLLDPEFTGPKMDEAGKNRHQQLIAMLSKVFEQGINEGFFRPAHPIKLAEMLILSCVSITRGRLLREDFGPIEEDALLVIEVFFKGIAKAGGEKC